MVGNSSVIDLQNEVKLWTYSGAEHVRSLNGIVFFAVSHGTDRNGALITAQLPHSNARDLLERALKDPVDFVLKPGATIRIDVGGIADESQRERVIQGLTKQLAANQWTVDPNGTLEAVATVEGPKETKVSFRQRGDYKFKEYTVRIKLVSQKQPIWESVSKNTPNIVQLKSGETMEDYLRGQEKPSYEFFERVVFPMYLMKPASGTPPGNSVTIGTSRVTVDGIQ